MKGFSAWAGGIALGLMMIPLIMRTTEEVLLLCRAVIARRRSRWASPLENHRPHRGADRAREASSPACCWRSRASAGETAPLLFTAFGNRYWNHSLNDPIAALPLQIFTYAISPYEDWHRQAWAGALVLVAAFLCVNVCVRVSDPCAPSSA